MTEPQDIGDDARHELEKEYERGYSDGYKQGSDDESEGVSALRTELQNLKNTMRDVIRLAQVSFDGDPHYAEQAGLDGDSILDKARTMIARGMR